MQSKCSSFCDPKSGCTITANGRCDLLQTKQQSNMQTLNINVKKIEKAALIVGEKGTYMNLTLMENREGPDQYGNAGFIIQDIGKERRLAGEKGPIIGNWKYVQASKPKPAAAPQRAQPEPDDDVCF